MHSGNTAVTNSSVPQSKIDFIIRWILGTFAGWILALVALIPGLVIGQIFWGIGWQHRDSQWYQIWSGWLEDAFFLLLALATLILMGLSVGLAQWRIALKGKITRKLWLLLSSLLIISAGIGFLISSRLSPGLLTEHTTGIMSGMDASYTLTETWFLAVLIRSIVVGAFIGIPQWFILRRFFHQAHYWLFSVVLGSLSVFASLVAIVAIVKSTLISMSLGCCITPVVFGAVTGLGLYNLLKRIKATSL
jgi:hypothetical protein